MLPWTTQKFWHGTHVMRTNK